MSSTYVLPSCVKLRVLKEIRKFLGMLRIGKIFRSWSIFNLRSLLLKEQDIFVPITLYYEFRWKRHFLTVSLCIVLSM